VSALQSVELTRFKCFASQTVTLTGATVLTGLNGMGKSSVIQALLLLRQSARAGLLRAPATGDDRTGLILNGDLTRLGTALDALYEGAAEDSIGLAVRTGDGELRWTFRATSSADLLPWIDGPASPPAHPLFGSAFYYLGAERIGPRSAHAFSASKVGRDEMGADGDLAVAFLDTHGDRAVAPGLLHDATPSVRLLQQVTAWMGEISPGVRLATQALTDLDLARLSFSFATDGATSRAFRPTSVGFGLSYTLPVIIAILAAPPGSLVLVENPEAHLHPRGQMAMGDLIARAATAGVQVIVETHSDHVMNGIRVAVKEGRATPEQVGFRYFRRITETRDGETRIVHVVDSPQIDVDGRLDQWPPGFFDQYDVALEKLL
jgi:predicted ATPase